MRTWIRGGGVGLALLMIPAMGGCAEPEAPEGPPAAEARLAEAVVAAAEHPGAADALRTLLADVQAQADAVDSVLHPVPLLRSREAAALRQYSNRQHVARARQLGIPRPSSDADLAPLVEAGRLVRLPDSTAGWIVRELDHSLPLLTPAAVALLDTLAARFQARIGAMGLPPYRLEVTSALRTPDRQADLRRQNANAARGVSAHEFGTTVDVAYSAFAAPVLDAATLTPEPWLQPFAPTIAAALLESVAAQRSRELQAILGQVLQELQAEGRVLVMLEERQPVYHLTLGQG